MENHQVKTLAYFEMHLEEGKSLFEDLTRKIRSKKAINLESKLFFFQVYLELLGKIHFKEKTLRLTHFSPFDLIFRSLKRIHHIKLIEQKLTDLQSTTGEHYPAYGHEIGQQKKAIYTDVFDTLVAAPLKIWEDLYVTVFSYSKGLTPLQLNTASTQIINEETEFAKFDLLQGSTPTALKNVYETLQKITQLENLRQQGRLNPVFTDLVHEKIRILTESNYAWYQNHLFFQHFIHFLSDTQYMEKKHLLLAKKVKKEHKALTEQALKLSTELFTHIL
ncbi:hypothetical protein ADIS_1661 [Lunatimonas lonarensis]|uniref:Uncharacterized protein n=1 Tax=Lunatimonas lonarensis TaxID=1232681 RepID=R7ZUI5_9BACT|nr:hypothetical protein [Lunatimonas lonarensis]EON77742.1 hypothetical protein ADIS_1661 [Lunatimonas lonarensis]